MRREQPLLAHALAQRIEARRDRAQAAAEEVGLEEDDAFADDRANAVEDPVPVGVTHQSGRGGERNVASVGRRGRSSQRGRRNPPGPGPGRARASHSR